MSAKAGIKTTDIGSLSKPSSTGLFCAHSGPVPGTGSQRSGMGCLIGDVADSASAATAASVCACLPVY
jgi:hypothetical protein